MIRKENGYYIIICDNCLEKSTDEEFDSWDEAVDWQKGNGTIEKTGGQWRDICPDCTEGGVTL